MQDHIVVCVFTLLNDFAPHLHNNSLEGVLFCIEVRVDVGASRQQQTTIAKGLETGSVKSAQREGQTRHYSLGAFKSRPELPFLGTLLDASRYHLGAFPVPAASYPQ